MTIISTYCCLNPLPPTSSFNLTSSPSSVAKINHVPRKVNEKSLRRSKQMMAIATTIVIVGDIIISNMNTNSYSMASEIGVMESQLLLPNNNDKKSVTRWSDKRICPPWHTNSLETIVPENLPRPSTHRKWEGVSLTPQSASSVKFISVKSRSNCFSM